MDTPVIKRIRELIGRTGLSQSQFSRQCGIAPPSFSRSMSNGTFSSEYLNRIAKAFDADINWLTMGVGEMFESIKQDDKAHEEEILKQFDELQAIQSASQKDALQGEVGYAQEDAKDAQEIEVLRQRVALLEQMVKDKNEEIGFLRNILNAKLR